MKQIKTIGFDPNRTIWNNQLAREEEKCPQWLKRWGNESNDKLDFLSDFGIITKTSVIYKIRLGLSSNNLFKNQIRTKSDIEEEWLRTTIEWIVEKELKFKNERRFELLKRIADRLELEFDEVLNEEKLQNNSISFDEVFDPDYY